MMVLFVAVWLGLGVKFVCLLRVVFLGLSVANVVLVCRLLVVLD